MRRVLLALFLLASLSCAAYYQTHMVRANDSTVASLAYDDNSTSYKDSSIENPDMRLRICAIAETDLLNKWVSLAYTNGNNSVEYIMLEHFPYQIRNVPPNLCVYTPLMISSFRAWYPSIPFVFISEYSTMNNSEKWKLSRNRGWFRGAYNTTASIVNGTMVNVTVVNATDDLNNSIGIDVNYLVVGIVQDDGLTVTGDEITSINDSVYIPLGGYSGNWTISINGIGPADDPIAPYVKIHEPQQAVYPSGQSAFIFTIIDNEQVDSCWYVLDGVRTDLPACDIAYSLNFSGGAHVLTLYANDTSNNIGFDNVTFYGPEEEEEPPPEPTSPPSPPAPTYATQPPPPPIIPPPPPAVTLTINPEDIDLIIFYPLEGVTAFTLISTFNLTNTNCYVRGPMAPYATVKLSSKDLNVGDVIGGTVSVDMTPTEILQYENETEVGLVQCVGEYGASLRVQTIGNLYVYFRKPTLVGANTSTEARAGRRTDAKINFLNNGTAPAVNISVQFPGLFDDWITVVRTPERVEPGEIGTILVTIDVPPTVQPQTYEVPAIISENGLPKGVSTMTIGVKKALFEPGVCDVESLVWSVWILIAGVVVSLIVFRRFTTLREVYWEGVERIEKGRDIRKRYGKAILYAAAIGLAAIIIWWLSIRWALGPCYV